MGGWNELLLTMAGWVGGWVGERVGGLVGGWVGGWVGRREGLTPSLQLPVLSIR